MSFDNDAAEDIVRSGPPTHKFEDKGDTLTLTLTGLRKSQQTDFVSGEPLTWPNGDPKFQYEITGTTPDGEETRIFAKGQMLNAVKESFRAANAKPEEGGVLVVKFDSEEPSKTKGFNPQKIYKAKYTAPVKSAVEDPDDLDAF